MAENAILSEAPYPDFVGPLQNPDNISSERKVFRTYAEYANFARSSPEFAQNKWVQYLEKRRRAQEQGLESKEESNFGDLTDDSIFGKLLYTDPALPTHQEKMKLLVILK